MIGGQAQNYSVMGGIVILLTPAPVINPFPAWKSPLFHKDKAKGIELCLYSNTMISSPPITVQYLDQSCKIFYKNHVKYFVAGAVCSVAYFVCFDWSPG